MNPNGDTPSLAKARAAKGPPKRHAPICEHTNERRAGQGKCRRCYNKSQRALLRNNPGPLPAGTRMATCHPERKHAGKGLCASCYMGAWLKVNPQSNSGNTWLKNHPEERRRHLRKSHLKAKHGTPIGVYESMWNAQGGKCANAGCSFTAPLDVPDFRRGGLHVDHDHTTGALLGLVEYIRAYREKLT